MKHSPIWLLLSLILLIIRRVTATISLNVIPGLTNGGQSTTYTILISAGSEADVPGTAQSLKLILPSQYNIASSLVPTCDGSSGFTNTSPACSVTTLNQIAIDFQGRKTDWDVGTPATFVIDINPIVNPLVEEGPFDYNLEFYTGANGGGTKLLTVTQSSTAKFIAPDLQAASLNFLTQVVFTSTSLEISLTPSDLLRSGSFVNFKAPFMDSASLSYFDTGGVTCTPTQNANAGLTCVLTGQTLKISDAFPNDVASGTEVKISLTGVFTPLSTSTHSGFEISLGMPGTNNLYMKKTNLGVSVSTPIDSSFTIFQSEQVVGGSGRLILSLINAAPTTSGYYLKIMTLAGLDLSSSTIQLATPKGTATATLIEGTLFTALALNSDTKIFVNTAKNRGWVEDSGIRIEMYDSNDKIAQNFPQNTVTFNPNQIVTVSIAPTPTTLGTSAKLVITWTAKTLYATASQALFTTPSALTKGAVTCTSSRSPSPTCNLSTNDISATGIFTADVGVDATSTFEIEGVVLPYCAQELPFTIAMKSATGFAIESGAMKIESNVFTPETLTFSAVVPSSQVAGESSNFEVQFNPGAILKQDSVLTFTLQADFSIVGATTCSVVSGLSGTPTCSQVGSTNVYIIANGVTTNRTPGTPIRVQVNGIGNPRAMGDYTVATKIETTAPICEYASGSLTYTINSVGNITSVITPQQNNRNLFTTYKIRVEPTSTSWTNTDYIEVFFPTGTAFSATIACSSITDNLISVTCTQETARSIKAATNIDPTKYGVDKNFEFNINFIQNPDIAGAETLYEVHIRTVAGNSFMMDTSFSVVFNDYITPVTQPSMTFATKNKGQDSYSTAKIKVNAFIPAGGIFEFQFVDAAKFTITGSETVKASTPAFTLGARRRNRLLIDVANRKIQIVATNDIAPDTQISVELNMKNPTANSISGPDVITKLLINSKQVLVSNSIVAELSFECDPLCLTCSGFYQDCNACPTGKFLNNNRCGDEIKETLTGSSAPFLFTALALILFVVVFFMGKWRNRNFSGNFYYGILRFIYFLALIGITFFFYINKDPTMYTFLMLGAILFHIVLSWISARSFKAVLASREFGGCVLGGIPRVGKPQAMFFFSVKKFVAHKLTAAITTPKDEQPQHIEKIGKEKEQKKFFKLFSSQIFMIFFHSQVTRVFFSSTSKGKTKEERKKPVNERALFWTWDQKTYENLKRSYSKHRNYYMFFQVLVLVLLIFSIIGLGGTETYIYLFKFDLGLLTIIDILAYTYAYNELNPRPEKKKKDKKGLKTLIKPVITEKNGDDDSVIIVNQDFEDNPLVKKKTGEILRDANGNIIGKFGKNGILFDEEGNIIEEGPDGKMLIKDKDGNLIAWYDKDGVKYNKFNEKIQDDQKGNTLVYNKKKKLIAKFDKAGNLVDLKNGKVILTKDEYEKIAKEGFRFDQEGKLYNPKQQLFFDPVKKLKYRLGTKGQKYFIEPKTGKEFILSKKGEKLYHDPKTGLYYKKNNLGKPIFVNEKGKPLSKKEIQKLIDSGKLKLGRNGTPIINNGEEEPDPLETVMTQDTDGIFRPKLVEREEFREKMKENKRVTKKLQKSIGNSKAKSKIFDDKTKNLKYQMGDSDATKNLPSNMQNDTDLVRRNAKFNKWWYTADKDYLEIIYEEDLDKKDKKIYENPDYDNKELEKKMNNIQRPGGIKIGEERQHTPRIRDIPGKDVKPHQGEVGMDDKTELDMTNSKSDPDKSINKFSGTQGEGGFNEGAQFGTSKTDALNIGPDMIISRALCDRNGFFIANDGKKYKFDKNHNMISEDGKVAALQKTPLLISKLNVDRVPNILRKYTTPYPPVKSNAKGEFIGNDSQKHGFDSNGNMLNDKGQIIPLKQGKDIVKDLNVDMIKDCPNKYKLDLVRPIVDDNGNFYGADGNLYHFNTSGDMLDSKNKILTPEQVKDKIDGLELDYVPNCPAPLKIMPAIITPGANGEFRGNDGADYKFTPEGSVINNQGKELPPDQADIILGGLNVDQVPLAPEKYKTDEKKPKMMNDGYFIGNDGENYKFDENGNLIDQDGNIVPKNKTDEMVKGLNLDHLENTPNEYRINKNPERPLVQRDGVFLGADGNNYKFDKDGKLLDENGDIVPQDKIPLIIDGIIVDSVPNCPPALKQPHIPAVDKDGYFVGGDGQKYRFDPNGYLVKPNGEKVSRDNISKALNGIDFRNLPNAPAEARNGDPRLSTLINPYGTPPLTLAPPNRNHRAAQSRFRGSDANYTRLGSVTVESQKERLTNPHMGDTMYVNLMADESFDLDINVEEIDDDEYNPENENIYAQPYQKNFKTDFYEKSQKSNPGSDSEDGRSRLATLGMMNIDSRSSLKKTGGVKKKRNNNLIKKGRKIDTRSRGSRSNNKFIHQPRLGYKDALASTLRKQKPIPNRENRRSLKNEPQTFGIDLRKQKKKRNHSKKKKMRKDNSFGTLMLNQLDKKKGKTSGIGFIKPYKRKQMTKTHSNFSNDKLLSIKQIYIDNIEKDKKKNPYSRTHSKTHSRANLME